MRTLRILTGLLAVLVVAAVAYYAAVLDQGRMAAHLPPALREAGPASLVALTVLLCSAAMLLLAPLIYALRACDVLATLVSLAALVTIAAVLSKSHASTDMLIAALIYLASAIFASVTFAARIVARQIRQSMNPASAIERAIRSDK